MFRKFSRFFDKSELLGMRLHPQPLYTTGGPYAPTAPIHHLFIGLHRFIEDFHWVTLSFRCFLHFEFFYSLSRLRYDAKLQFSLVGFSIILSIVIAGPQAVLSV